MVATISYLVDTDGSVGVDGVTHTSVRAALEDTEATYPSTVSSDVEVHIGLRCTAGTADGSVIGIAVTTDATHPIILEAEPGYEAGTAWDDNTYRIISGWDSCLGINVDDIHIVGVQAWYRRNYNYSRPLSVGSRARVIGCIARCDYDADGIFVNAYEIYESAVIAHNIILGPGLETAVKSGVMLDGNQYDKSSIVANNTIVGFGTGVSNRRPNTSGLTVKNNIIQGCLTTCANLNGSDSGVTHNTTDLASMGDATGTDNQLSTSIVFTGPGDYALDATDTAARDTGANLTGIVPAVDILGTVRPQGTAWDRGAVESLDSGTTYQLSVTDIVNCNDNSTGLLNIIVSATNTVNLSDITNVGLIQNIIAETTSTLSETPYANLLFNLNQSEQVNISDNSNLILLLNLTSSDAVSLLDSNTFGNIFTISTTETINISEQILLSKILNLNSSDTITASDNSSSIIAYLCSIDENISLDDTVNTVANILFELESTDSTILTDIASAILSGELPIKMYVAFTGASGTISFAAIKPNINFEN